MLVAGGRALLPAFRSGTTRSMRNCSAKSAAGAARLVLIGDVHNHWDKDDVTALKHLQPDVALFVGDFGEEVVDLVQSIKQQVDAEGIPAAYVLGNHDAWHSLHKKDLEGIQDPRLAGVQAQLGILGHDHVGYSSKRFPDASVTVVGARPFSAGGSSWNRAASFHNINYGVESMQDSADRVYDCISRAPSSDAVVVMAHNGPAGVGSETYSICGKDWSTKGGDHGDPDLRMVLNRAQSDGKPIPLVVFGHMHHKLYHASGFRQMVHIEGNGTVLLNAAVVPRWVAQPSNGRTGTVKQHQFTVVELVASVVQTVTQVWVGVADSKCWIADTKTIVKSEASNDGNFVRSYAVPDQSGAGPATRLWSEKDMWFTVAHSAASCSPLDINASCTRT